MSTPAAPGRRGVPKALRHRQFRLWYAGSSLSVLGDQMVPVALTFAVLARYRSAGAVGTVLTAETAPVVVMLLVGGVVADRVSRRLLLLACDLLSALAAGAAAALLFWGHWQLWQLAIAFGVLGAATGLSSPALLGMLADTVPEADRQQAQSLRGLAQSSAAIAGPVLAGLLAGLGSGGLALAINAGTFVASAGFLLAMAPVPAPAGASRASPLHDLRVGWRAFWERSWVWSIVAQFGLFHLVVYPPIMVLGAIVSQRHLGGASAWGLTLAGLGAGSVVGGLVMLRWRPHRPLLAATFGALPFGLLAATLALRTPEWTQIVVAFGVGLGLQVFDVLWSTALSVHVPPHLLSRVSAYDWFGSVVLLPVGYAIVGPVAAGLGIAPTLWVAAASWLVLTALVLLVRDVRTMPRLSTEPG